jgi:hypothetical protein
LLFGIIALQLAATMPPRSRARPSAASSPVRELSTRAFLALSWSPRFLAGFPLVIPSRASAFAIGSDLSLAHRCRIIRQNSCEVASVGSWASSKKNQPGAAG